MIDIERGDLLVKDERWPYIERHHGKIITYALRAGESVKIGKSHRLGRRIQQLRTGIPTNIELLAVASGDVERRTHEALRLHGVRRLCGEWFEHSELLEQILLASGFVFCVLERFKLPGSTIIVEDRVVR